MKVRTQVKLTILLEGFPSNVDKPYTKLMHKLKL